MKKIPNRVKILAEAIYNSLEEDNPFFSKVDNKDWSDVDQFIKDFYHEMAAISLKAVQLMKSEINDA